VKQLIYGAFLSLITGICFTIGVFGVVLSVEAWRGDMKGSRKGDWVNSPPGLTIAEHERVEGTQSFTIRGVVKSESDRVWFAVGIEAKIFAAQSQMNECDTTVRGRFAPGERRAFQIECYGVAGTGTLENITYRIGVVHGEAES
jgi:hypothetical protein